MNPITTVQLLGKKGTGTTCLLVRLAENRYTDEYISTLGVSFKNVNLGESREVAVYDVDHILPKEIGVYSLCAKPDMYMLCVDVTDPASLDSAKIFLNDIKRYRTDNPPYFMVATKVKSSNVSPELVEQLQSLCETECLPPPVMTDAKVNFGIDQIPEMIKSFEKPSAITKLEKYIALRKQERESSGSEYNSIWARLFTPNFNATNKISAAEKAMEILNGNMNIKMTPNEMAALTQGRLKELIANKMEIIEISQNSKIKFY